MYPHVENGYGYGNGGRRSFYEWKGNSLEIPNRCRHSDLHENENVLVTGNGDGNDYDRLHHHVHNEPNFHSSISG